MKRNVLLTGDYQAPVSYTVAGVAFSRFTDGTNRFKSLYVANGFLVQPIDEDAHQKRLDRMHEEAVAETPYYMTGRRPRDTLQQIHVFGLFSFKDRLDVTNPAETPPLKLRGYAACGVARYAEQRAVLSGSYIDPTCRGRRLAQLLYQARVDWAAACNIPKVSTYPCEHNAASRRAAEMFGFVLKPGEEEERTWGQGFVAQGQIGSLRIRYQQTVAEDAAVPSRLVSETINNASWRSFMVTRREDPRRGGPDLRCAWRRLSETPDHFINTARLSGVTLRVNSAAAYPCRACAGCG